MGCMRPTRPASPAAHKGPTVSITGTLIVQIIVFLILVWFTMKFVWPPVTAALDERAQKIADGLAAADKAKADLGAANQRVADELSKARTEVAARLAQADRQGQTLIEQAKTRATDEAHKILAAAQAEAEQQTLKAREALRAQVAVLAVKGAEQILRKEVNATAHSELLERLKAEL